MYECMENSQLAVKFRGEQKIQMLREEAARDHAPLHIRIAHFSKSRGLDKYRNKDSITLSIIFSSWRGDEDSKNCTSPARVFLQEYQVLRILPRYIRAVTKVRGEDWPAPPKYFFSEECRKTHSPQQKYKTKKKRNFSLVLFLLKQVDSRSVWRK